MLGVSCILLSLSAAFAWHDPIYEGEIALQSDIQDVILSPLPSETVRDEEVPTAWDWRGKNVMSTDLNQHIPV